MLHLYLGYLFIQLFSVVDKVFSGNIATSAMFFSIIVFLIWSFVPILGYVFSKLFRILPSYNKLFFLGYGIFVSLIENGLFYFNILSYEENVLSTSISFALFFIIAFIPQPKKSAEL
jgi:hypothetical protein